MSISITICWYMGGDEGRATANVAVPGCLALESNDEDSYPDLNIYLDNPRKAQMAAAAINGDWGRVRELLDGETVDAD